MVRRAKSDPPRDPRLRVIDEALGSAVRRGEDMAVIDHLLDMRNSVLKDMET